MAKDKSHYECSSCGASAAKWAGQCPGCGEWNTLTEVADQPDAGPQKNRFSALNKARPVETLSDIEEQDCVRAPTGIEEFDRVLGGGLVQGGVALLAGDPGIGKSTLMLQASEALSRDMKVLYVSGEESTAQIKLRAARLGLSGQRIRVMSEICLETVLATLAKEQSGFVAIDSIQTMYSSALTSAPGSVSQVRECAAHLTRYAKMTGTSVLLIGHSTKDQSIAGPRTLEHVVDVVAFMAGEPGSAYRLLRASKNRFGSTNEVGVFALLDTGMKCVSNPSAIFLSMHKAPAPGSCVMVTMEGTRPLLVEVQALVDTGGPSPRRLSVGLERDRLAMLLAVMHKHADLTTADQDVFVNAVGGVRITEPAADLAVMMAIQSSLRGKALPKGMFAFGEVGLSGEVRPAPRGQERLREAAKLGFSIAVTPQANVPKVSIEGLQIHGVDRVEEAMDLIRTF